MEYNTATKPASPSYIPVTGVRFTCQLQMQILQAFSMTTRRLGVLDRQHCRLLYC